MRDKVLVLTGDAPEDAEWIATLKAGHLSLTVAREWPAALQLLRPRSAQVIVCNACSQTCPVSEVLAVAQIADLPVIVVGRDLDAGRWLDLYKGGAYQVVSLPAQPRQILEAVNSAIKAAWAKSTSATRGFEATAAASRQGDRV